MLSALGAGEPADAANIQPPPDEIPDEVPGEVPEHPRISTEARVNQTPVDLTNAVNVCIRSNSR